jgi:hypothetical protein
MAGPDDVNPFASDFTIIVAYGGADPGESTSRQPSTVAIMKLFRSLEGVSEQIDNQNEK